MGRWLLLTCGALTAASEDSGEELSAPTRMPSLFWDGGLSLRMWGGYKDNPQLSALNPRGSGFLAGGGDAMIYRLPLDGTEIAFYGLVEHVAYFADDMVPETMVALDGRFKRRWESGWWLGMGTEYSFLRQVFDASEIVGVPVVVPAVGHTLTVRPGAGYEFGAGWRIEVEGEGSRQWFAPPLDSFWDGGFRLAMNWKGGEADEWGGWYRLRDRQFDARNPRDSEGGVLPGTLSYLQHETELHWRRHWDAGKRWRTVVRAGFLNSTDNGGGFFDYDRWHVSGQVVHAVGPWEFRVEAKGRWYLYPVQRAGPGAEEHRRRSGVTAAARAAWRFHTGFRLFVQYDLELSDENVLAADYRANTMSAGIEMEL